MNNLVFIDGSIPDPQAIIDSLTPGSRWFLLEGGGLAEIAAIAGRFTGMDSVQIVSHGAKGALLLGGETVGIADIDAHAADWAAIGACLTAEGDILLYGCGIAGGDEGAAFIRQVAQSTGGDVAASDDATGPLSLGGDSVLEVSTGGIEAAGIDFSSYGGILELGGAGKVKTDVGNGLRTDIVRDVAVQADGRIVAVGESNGFKTVIRLNADLSQDFSYFQSRQGTSGLGSLNAVALQADGKAVAGGSDPSGGVIERRNTDGTLDTTFGSGGIVTTNFAGAGGAIKDLVIQAGGGIVVVGVTLAGDFVVQRYNANGSIDITFGTSGTVITDLAGTDTANGVVVQADGRIVVAGSNDDGSSDFVIVRYTASGALDTSFSGDGRFEFTFGAADFCAAIAQQADGRYVLAGYSSINSATNGANDFALARVNANGTLDTAFDSEGILTTDFSGGDDRATSIAIQSDGKIVVGGSGGTGSDTFAIARYNTNGSLDTTFSGDGKAQFAVGASGSVNSTKVLADGSILLAGEVDLNSTPGLVTAANLGFFKLSGSGLADGGAIYDIRSVLSDDVAYDVAIRSDGKYIVAGSAAGRPALLRYNADGTLDTTFGGDGRIDFGTTVLGTIRGVAIQGDGKIVVTGTGFNGGTSNDIVVVRLDINGFFDFGFGTTGTAIAALAGNQAAYDVVIQSDGKILVAGESGGDFAAVRFTTAGVLDTTYDTDGMVTTNIGGPDQGRAAVVQADGKLVVAGSNFLGSSADFAVVRYTTAGVLDTTFSGDGITSTTFDAEDIATGVALQADGKVVVVGYTNVNAGTTGPNDFAIARFNANGSIDTTFSSDGRTTVDMGADDRANSVAIQSDGKILVGGSFNGGASDFAIVRLNANGSLDTSFSGDGKANFTFDANTFFGGAEFAYSLKVQADGKIIVVGSSDSGTGGGDNDIAMLRLNADGTLDTSFIGDGETTYGTDAANALNGTYAGDKLFGFAGDDFLTGRAGNDSLDGGGGFDYANYLDPTSTAGITVSLAAAGAQNTGGAGTDTLVGIEGLYGSNLGDTLAGDDAAVNALYGWGGADGLYGNGGFDYIEGGEGEDTLGGGAGDDFLIGGNGGDWVVYNDSSAAVYVDMSGASAFANGSATGFDVLSGIERVYGSAFGDFLFGSAGADTLVGDQGSDIIYGFGLGDSLDGGADTDYIVGGAGADTITTGTGQDFIYFQGQAEGKDTVTDWRVSGFDLLVIDEPAFGAGLVAGQYLSSESWRFVTGTAATANFGQFIWNGATSTLSWDADGTGAGVAVQLVTLTGVSSLTAGDILVL
jgi:uncharacterized delta-60 repeat protein